jgi:hypothetical protein
VVRIDGVDFPALGRYEKDYATYGYDYGTRNPEQTYSTPDECVRRQLAQLTPPSYIVASTGWVPPVTVSSPSRRGSLHAAQTVTG